MIKRILGIGGLFVLVLILPVNAEQLNFNDFLTTAINNSYQVKISKIDTEITKKGIKEAKSAYMPIISAYATTQRYNDLANGNGNITAVGSEILLNQSYYQDMASLGLTYNLFDFGIRRKQLEIAKADNKQKEIVLLKNQQDLKLDAVEIYAQTLDLYKQLQIKKEALELQIQLLDINKKLRLAGEISEIDVVDNEIKVAEIKSELDNINNDLAKKLTEISYYTNKEYNPNDIEIKDFNDVVSIEPGEPIKLSAVVSSYSPETSPEIKAYDLEIYKKQKEYEIQKKPTFLKFNLIHVITCMVQIQIIFLMG